MVSRPDFELEGQYGSRLVQIKLLSTQITNIIIVCRSLRFVFSNLKAILLADKSQLCKPNSALRPIPRQCFEPTLSCFCV